VKEINQRGLEGPEKSSNGTLRKRGSEKKVGETSEGEGKGEGWQS